MKARAIAAFSGEVEGAVRIGPQVTEGRVMPVTSEQTLRPQDRRLRVRTACGWNGLVCCININASYAVVAKGKGMHFRGQGSVVTLGKSEEFAR